MKILKLLKKYKMIYQPGDLKPNYNKLPKNFINANAEGVKIFNELYKTVINEDYFYIDRTPSGGISVKNHVLKFPSFDIIANKSGIEMTILTGDAMCRIIFSAILNRTKDKHKITGTQAWRLFKSTLDKYNINIEDYRITKEEGLEVKKDIKYCKKLLSNAYKDIEWTNVHHLDYNSSYPAGLVNLHPEFKDAINYLYERRHTNEMYKSILNNSISGYLQSKYVNYGFAHLCRDAINDNFNRINDLIAKLEWCGRVPLMVNSDGIWYQGDIYHDENEGTELGQWKNDHINCKFRAKSDATYEYIENNKYVPVVPGFTRLDKIKSREDWQWGDIYNYDCNAITYKFKEGEGIYEQEIKF